MRFSTGNKIFATFASVCSLSLAACADRPASVHSASNSMVRGTLNSETVELKSAKENILAFATLATERANQDETSIAASRIQMTLLIDELMALAPAASFDAKLSLALGAWQEVWSDARNPSPPGQKILRPLVYQVLFENGRGYNFGVRSIMLPTGAELIATSAIKLDFVKDIQKDQLNVTFLKTFSKQGDLSAEPSILKLAQGVEAGTRPDFAVDPDRVFPRGPVGAKGPLELVYVDDDLRIAQGANPYTNIVDTFVLVRVPESAARN